MVKKIGIKIVLLIVVVTLLNCIYQFTLLKRDIGQMAPCAYQCLKLPENVDYVYFGESSNFTADGDDSTLLTISELIAYYSKKNIVTIDTPAVHAGIYKHWINCLKNNKPKGIIVTMNLRSFGTDWIHSVLESNLNRSLSLLKYQPKILSRLLLSLKYFGDSIPNSERDSLISLERRTKKIVFPYQFKYNTVREWDYHVGNGSHLKPDGSWDMDKIVLAAHYVKNFAFNLDSSNIRIKDFDDIVSWGANNNVKVYFNLLSENVAQADTLVGKDLVFLLKKNRDFLVERYTKKGAIVIDNLESVGINDFLDKNWTTEHYNYKGRISIAKKVAEKIK